MTSNVIYLENNGKLVVYAYCRFSIQDHCLFTLAVTGSIKLWYQDSNVIKF